MLTDYKSLILEIMQNRDKSAKVSLHLLINRDISKYHFVLVMRQSRGSKFHKVSSKLASM